MGVVRRRSAADGQPPRLFVSLKRVCPLVQGLWTARARSWVFFVCFAATQRKKVVATGAREAALSRAMRVAAAITHCACSESFSRRAGGGAGQPAPPACQPELGVATADKTSFHLAPPHRNGAKRATSNSRSRQRSAGSAQGKVAGKAGCGRHKQKTGNRPPSPRATDASLAGTWRQERAPGYTAARPARAAACRPPPTSGGGWLRVATAAGPGAPGTRVPPQHLDSPAVCHCPLPRTRRTRGGPYGGVGGMAAARGGNGPSTHPAHGGNAAIAATAGAPPPPPPPPPRPRPAATTPSPPPRPAATTLPPRPRPRPAVPVAPPPRPPPRPAPPPPLPAPPPRPLPRPTGAPPAVPPPLLATRPPATAAPSARTAATAAAAAAARSRFSALVAFPRPRDAAAAGAFAGDDFAAAAAAAGCLPA